VTTRLLPFLHCFDIQPDVTMYIVEHTLQIDEMVCNVQILFLERLGELVHPGINRTSKLFSVLSEWMRNLPL